MQHINSTFLSFHTKRISLIILSFSFLSIHGFGQYTPGSGNILYVSKTATGTATGDSWGNAIPELRDALIWAASNNTTPLQIWVAAGTYTPTDDGDRLKSFSLVNNVSVYGGFAGIESNLKDRDWETNKTILSGDLNGDDGLDFANNEENSLRVFYNFEVDETALLDGFTISGGNGDAPYGPNTGGVSGAAMYNSLSSFTLTRVHITENYTSNSGGGIDNFMSPIHISESIISGNKALGSGGGILNWESNNIIIENVIIKENAALNGAGGGIHSVNSDNIIIKNVIIKENTAINGGGVYNSASSVSYISTVISDNISNGIGGGMSNFNNSEVTLTNSVITNNEGDAINHHPPYESETHLNNTIVLGNTIPISSNTLPNLYISNSLVQVGNETSGGNLTGSGAAIVNTTSDDIFNDFSNKDYTLKAGSYAIDAGDNALYNLVGDVDTDGDLANNQRLAGVSIDLGAYEYGGRSLPVRLVAFDVVRSGNDALLQWSTATESNNEGFYIEHSDDGSNWSDVAFVATQAQQGNSQSLLTYNYTDINPGKGQHFYRLRQVDLDGAYSYSDVKVVVFESRADISVYPNPVRSSVTISGLGDDTYQLSLMNGAGQVINQYKVQSQAQFKIDMSGLASGVYYVQIVDEQGKIESKKVMKQ